MGTSIVVTSGKGGTGKTAVSAAVSTALALLGFKTLAVDCDIGLKNLDMALGLTDATSRDFLDILSGNVTAEQAIVPHPLVEGLFLLPAPSGLDDEVIDRERFSGLIASLKEEYDYILLDSPAGLGSGFRLAAGAANSAVIVSTGESACLRDGARTVAELNRLGISEVRLIINRASPRRLKKFRRTADDIIDAVGARLIGVVSEDESVPLAAECEKPLMLFGAKYAYDQFFRIARRISGERVELSPSAR